MVIPAGLIFAAFSLIAGALENENPTDTITAQKGRIVLHCLGHGSLMIEYQKLRIYIDPISKVADYSAMPKADLILITHEHHDHLDPDVIRLISGPHTQIILNKSSFAVLKQGTVMGNGESKTIDNIVIDAVPAYNTTQGREMYHPKGRDNGYVLTIGGKRIYIAGDTENIPEMKNLNNIDIAFLPMNQPYTMTPDQVARAAQSFMPKILYPYHTGDTDVSTLSALMKDSKAIELRVRNMQ